MYCEFQAAVRPMTIQCHFLGYETAMYVCLSAVWRAHVIVWCVCVHVCACVCARVCECVGVHVYSESNTYTCVHLQVPKNATNAKIEQ